MEELGGEEYSSYSFKKTWVEEVIIYYMHYDKNILAFYYFSL
jgi:hypothetical protein